MSVRLSVRPFVRQYGVNIFKTLRLWADVDEAWRVYFLLLPIWRIIKPDTGCGTQLQLLRREF